MLLQRSLFFTLLTVASICNAQTSTFNDVAPILYKNCTNCHRSGGGAPFSMLSFNSIAPWTTSMVHALQHGEMPPWGADTSYMHFVNERPITQSDKSALLNWILDSFYSNIFFFKYTTESIIGYALVLYCYFNIIPSFHFFR